jgi:aminoglycoside phosphotransferase (APT) family kinase protein
VALAQMVGRYAMDTNECCLMEWTDADARRVATVMCALAGLQDSKLELLRFGSNAVFGIGEAHVLRVMRPTTSQADVQREIHLVSEFARLDIPTARLSDIPAQQPLEALNCLGTVWERLDEPDPDHLYRALGQLMQLFHQRTTELRVPLERWHQLASSDWRLAKLRGHYAPEDVMMLTRWSRRIAAELDQVEPALPAGVIHGQAEVGNVLFRAGRPVLIDFEQVAIGPREWDLVHTAVAVTRFGRLEKCYRDFADAYGVDIRTWDGYETYRRLWELCATTWLMQHGHRSRKVAQEIEVRLQTWRDDNSEMQWSGVLENAITSSGTPSPD